MVGKLYQKERGVFAEETFLFCHLQLIIVIIEWYKDILFYKLFQVLFMRHDLQKYTCKKKNMFLNRSLFYKYYFCKFRQGFCGCLVKTQCVCTEDTK